MDIIITLDKLVPSAKFFGYPESREDYEELDWRDERKKPTWSELEQKWLEIKDKINEPEPTEVELLQQKVEDLESRLAALEQTR